MAALTWRRNRARKHLTGRLTLLQTGAPVSTSVGTTTPGPVTEVGNVPYRWERLPGGAETVEREQVAATVQGTILLAHDRAVTERDRVRLENNEVYEVLAAPPPAIDAVLRAVRIEKR